MKTKRETWQVVLVAFYALISAFQVQAGTLFKANNTLVLNDPLSWEGGVVPGPTDIAVFDERVMTNNITSFVLTNNLSWRGMVFTNSVAPTNVMIGTVVLMTNGVDAATLTLGSNGVALAGSGYALTLNVPLALSQAQTWQLDRRNLTLNTTVSGSVPWVLDMPSQTVWSVASGYSGALTLTNTTSLTRFDKAGQWAQSLTLRGSGSSRWEMRFTTPIRWSELFLDRTATVNFWSGLTAGGTLQFDDGDVYSFPGGRFTLDSGTVVQNGGALSGYEVQCQYSTYNGIYVMHGGTLDLSSGLLLGNGLSSAMNEARFQLKGGTFSANSVKVGWSGCKYGGLCMFEVTGGVFRVAGSRSADSGVHLSWSDTTNAYENSGLFLMRGGLADVDQISLGRSEAAAGYATTNALSMFKMSGGELVLGSRGFYAGRTWNKGNSGSAYAYKLSGGTLTAGDSWSSALDLFLSDAEGGTTFNTADTNGVGQRVVLNGAVYGPGKLRKVGAGTLVLAGEAAYAGPTTVEAGTLMVGSTLTTADCFRWTADSVSDTNNAPVLTWTDVNRGIAATNTTVTQAPRLIANELNGRSVLRFNSSASQYLVVEAAKSPISGATNFSIVIVFKTGTSGAGSAGYWYQNTGLVDAEQGGIQNDWGLAYNGAGQVCGGAGYPSPNKDWTVYSSAANSVVNNQPHIAIYTWQGTNLMMNVDGRVTTAVSTSPVVSPRNTYRMLFGSMNLLGGYYFNGDIAEIRIYRNRTLSATEQHQVGSELSALYGVPNAVFEEASVQQAVAGEIVPSTGWVEPLPYEAAVWDADTLTGTNNSAVTAWASTNGLRIATVAGVGKSVTAPTLIANAINGHHAVRFTGSLMTGLGIPAAQNPVGGSTNFTVAFVFRTTTAGKTTNQWYSSIGIVDAEQPGAANDWGVSFSAEGRLLAGIGNADVTSTSKIFDLHDGAPHAVVIAYDMVAGTVAIMADGLGTTQSVGAHLAPRSAYRIVLGSLDALGGQFFTGDLAALRVFPNRALTSAEMAALSLEMGTPYGVRPMPRGNVVFPQATGLGRGDVEIRSGASLVLPIATNSAVTLTSGQVLSGSGAVYGTLALASGAILDIGLAEPLTMDVLWLNAGAILRWNHANGVGATLPVSALKTTATATLQVVGGSALPERVAVLSYTSVTQAAATVWTVLGAKPNSHVVINTAAKTIDIVTPRGTMLLIR